MVSWWRIWLARRMANIRDPRTLYYLIAEHLGSRRLPSEPCVLQIRVPPDDWAWLQQQQLQSEYERGLSAFVQLHLQRLGRPSAIHGVTLIEGEVWKLEWRSLDAGVQDILIQAPPQTRISEPPNAVPFSSGRETEEVSPAQSVGRTHPEATEQAALGNGDTSALPTSQSSYGVFVVPRPSGALWIPWTHPFNPRVPTQEEGSATPDCLQNILQGLIPGPDDRLWQSGESHTVCGQQVEFYWTQEARS